MARKASAKLNTKYPIVAVCWHDAEVSAQWESIDAIANDTLPECLSVGFLLSETDTHLNICGTVSSEDCNQRIKIPVAWVVSRTTLRKASQ